MRLLSIASILILANFVPTLGLSADFRASEEVGESTYIGLGIDCDRINSGDVVVRVDPRPRYLGYPLCVERDRKYDRRPYFGYLTIDQKTRRMTQYREVPVRGY